MHIDHNVHNDGSQFQNQESVISCANVALSMIEQDVHGWAFHLGNRWAARARALAASSRRFLGGAFV
jgi:hypothetical protein